MSEVDQDKHLAILEMATEISAAYVRNNPLERTQVPDLLRDVLSTLSELSDPVEVVEEIEEPAVSVKASIKNDKMICMCCGKSFTSLKRHLAVAHGLTPDQYRAKWNLPPSYPMVAPTYSKLRSQISLDTGLGRKK
ncbi:MAG: MucR family transcriptional regulator [Pseudomonadota bacterium]